MTEIEGEMKEIPWVKASLQFTCKTKSIRKLSGARWAIAPKFGISMSKVLIGCVKAILEFYEDATELTAGEFNAEMDEFRKSMAGVKFYDVESEPTK